MVYMCVSMDVSFLGMSVPSRWTGGCSRGMRWGVVEVMTWWLGRSRGWGGEDEERTSNSGELWPKPWTPGRTVRPGRRGTRHLAGVSDQDMSDLVEVQSRRGPRVHLRCWASLHWSILGAAHPSGLMCVRHQCVSVWRVCKGGVERGEALVLTWFKDSCF